MKLKNYIIPAAMLLASCQDTPNTSQPKQEIMEVLQQDEDRSGSENAIENTQERKTKNAEEIQKYYDDEAKRRDSLTPAQRISEDTTYILSKFVDSSRIHKDPYFRMPSVTPLQEKGKYVCHLKVREPLSEMLGEFASCREGSSMDIYGYYSDKECKKPIIYAQEYHKDVYMQIKVLK